MEKKMLKQNDDSEKILQKYILSPEQRIALMEEKIRRAEQATKEMAELVKRLPPSNKLRW
jgi:hypothetical protein